jgi:hypothetical protein
MKRKLIVIHPVRATLDVSNPLLARGPWPFVALPGNNSTRARRSSTSGNATMSAGERRSLLPLRARMRPGKKPS